MLKEVSVGVCEVNLYCLYQLSVSLTPLTYVQLGLFGSLKSRWRGQWGQCPICEHMRVSVTWLEGVPGCGGREFLGFCLLCFHLASLINVSIILWRAGPVLCCPLFLPWTGLSAGPLHTVRMY